MFRFSASKISLALSALLCAGFAQAQSTPVSPLVASPTSVSVNFTLPSTQGAAVAVGLTVASGSYSFVVDPSTVPFWLSLDSMGGTATTTPTTIHFQASTYAGSLSGGVYTASVHVRVSSYQDYVIPVTLSVILPSATVTVATTPAETSGTVDLTYTPNSGTYPSTTITVSSSNTPVAFTAAVSGTGLSPAAPAGWVELSAPSGIAYNFGTSVTVTFLKDVLQNSAVGAILTATVNIVSGGVTTPVPIQITVLEPPATLSGSSALSPAAVPVQASGSKQIVVNGFGFYAAATGITATTVYITYTGQATPTDITTITSKTGSQTGSVTVVNPTTMIVSIPFEDGAGTPNGILSVAQSITLYVSNDGGTTKNSTALNVTASPIIYSVTDGAGMQEAAPGAAPKFAPYEIVTIFGANFCGGCGSTVVATTTSNRYPTSLTIGTHALSVAFNNQAGAAITNGAAYLLFANDTQINALVPSAIIGSGITGLQIVVTYNAVAGANYVATPAAVDPGIFTTSAAGNGQGAILLSADYSVNSSTNAAKTGSTVLIYATGLGAPNSTSALSSSSKGAVFPTTCIAPATYVTDASLTNPGTADGAVLDPTVWQSANLPPCFATKNYVTVNINGQAGTVTYAGWVADSVTGLYQVNVTIPSKATTSATAVSVPVTMTVNGVAAQTGVTMYIKQ